MKNNKGITLIALVVTIIVLLILAGVSIAMLSGNDGILNRASQASVANAVGEGKDQVALYIAELSANYYAAKYNGETVTPAYTSGTLVEYINSAKNNINALSKANSYTVTYTEATVTGEGDEQTTTPASIKVEAAKDSTKYSTVTIVDGKIGTWVDTNL